MGKSANKGEWSEPYAFIFLALNGKVFDKTINSYRIVREIVVGDYETVIRPRNKSDGRYVDIYKIGEGEIEECGKTPSIDFITSVKLPPDDEIKDQLHKALRLILESTKGPGSWENEIIKGWCEKFHVLHLKSGSSKKDDFRMRLKGSDVLIGISVKSELGGRPAVINASSKMIFVFEVNSTLSTQNLNVAGSKGPITIYKTITSFGGSISFVRVRNRWLRETLLGDDGCNVYPKMMIERFNCRGGRYRDIISRMVAGGHKYTKRVIENIAYRVVFDEMYGLKPDTDDDVPCFRRKTEGFISVLRDGSVVFENPSVTLVDSQEKMLDALYFDTGSTTRWDTSYVYDEGTYPPSTFESRDVKSLSSVNYSRIDEGIIETTEKCLFEASGVPIGNNRSEDDKVVLLSKGELPLKWRELGFLWVRQDGWRGSRRFLNIVLNVKIHNRKIKK